MEYVRLSFKQKRRIIMSKINLKTATLGQIEDECDRVYGTPYGHNIIGIMCEVVKDRFGQEEADRLFEEWQV